MAGSAIRLTPGTNVWLRSRMLHSDLDCLTLFMGEHTRSVVEAHGQIVGSFSSGSTPEDIAARLAAFPAVQECYETRLRGDWISVILRDRLYRRQAQVDDLELELKVSHRRNALLEEMPVRRLAALGILLQSLRGTSTEDFAISRLRDRLSEEDAGWAVKLLGSLGQRGFLTMGSLTSNRLAAPDSSPRVTFLGHSSLLVQSGDDVVLVDPLLRFDLGLPRAAFDMTRLRLGAILCSHSHWDHCDPQTYLWFDKAIPVLIPRVSQPTAFNPPIAPVFARLGFRDIREVKAWERVNIGAIEITAVPFYGEQDEPGEEVDHITYVIRCKSLSLYGGVDIFRDTFGEMTPVLERVRDELRPNIAFLPCSDVVYRYEQGGGNRFCRYFDSSRLSQSFQYTASAHDAARWAAILGAEIICPYALFLLSRWSSHPGVHALERALGEIGLGERFWPLRPLESLSAEDLGDRRRRRIRRRASVAWFRLASLVARLGSRAT